MKPALPLSLLLLTGCVHITASAKPVCLQMREYSQSEREALSAAVLALQPFSPMLEAYHDYDSLRAQNRKCLNAGKPKTTAHPAG